MKLDPITQKEIEFFRERKIDEHMKISGQIARDLRRLGGGKKKLAILDLMKIEWCRAEDSV